MIEGTSETRPTHYSVAQDLNGIAIIRHLNATCYTKKKKSTLIPHSVISSSRGSAEGKTEEIAKLDLCSTYASE